MLNVYKLEKSYKEEWRNYVKENYQSSIYHTVEWRNVLLKSFKGKDFYLVAKDDGSQILGILPLILTNTLRGKAFVSLPFRDRGGAVFSNLAALHELLKVAKNLAIERKAGFVELKYCNDLQKEEFDTLSSEGFLYHKTMEVVTLELKKYCEGIMEGINNEPLKRNIKKALQNNLEISTETDINSLSVFYKLFFDARKQLGVPVFDFSLFKNLFDELSPYRYIKLFLVKFNDISIAGGIFLLFKDRIIYAYGASKKEYLYLRPNDFLFYKVIEWGINNDFKVLDFGADSPLQKGLIDFKMKWGGEKFLAFSFYYLNRLKKIPEFDHCQAKYNFARSVIKAMPDSIYRWFSRLVIR